MWTFNALIRKRGKQSYVGDNYEQQKTEEYLNKSDFSQKIDNKHQRQQLNCMLIILREY